MKAPKLRGPFRNVRTEPRSFVFKSRHLSDSRPEWEERKRRVEEEVHGASDAPRPIKFRQGARDSEGRAARRAASIKASRMAALRAAGVAVVLVYLTYRAILWVESHDYGQFLHFMQSNG
jgi:hypothetical protein